MQASKSLCSLEASSPLSGGRMQLRSLSDSRMLCSSRTCMKLARMWEPHAFGIFNWDDTAHACEKLKVESRWQGKACFPIDLSSADGHRLKGFLCAQRYAVPVSAC